MPDAGGQVGLFAPPAPCETCDRSATLRDGLCRACRVACAEIRAALDVTWVVERERAVDPAEGLPF